MAMQNAHTLSACVAIRRKGMSGLAGTTRGGRRDNYLKRSCVHLCASPRACTGCAAEAVSGGLDSNVHQLIGGVKVEDCQLFTTVA